MRKPLSDIFRENLKFYRKQQKLSQEKLSELLDKHMGYINTIESGKSLPPIDVIDQIAAALKIKPSALFETPQPTEKQIHTIIRKAASEIADNAKEILESYLL